MNLYRMLRDVIVVALYDGDFISVAMVLMANIVILKMSSKDVGTMVFRLLDLAQLRCVTGYTLAFFFLAGWLAYAKRLKRRSGAGRRY